MSTFLSALRRLPAGLGRLLVSATLASSVFRPWLSGCSFVLGFLAAEAELLAPPPRSTCGGARFRDAVAIAAADTLAADAADDAAHVSDDAAVADAAAALARRCAPPVVNAGSAH